MLDAKFGDNRLTNSVYHIISGYLQKECSGKLLDHFRVISFFLVLFNRIFDIHFSNFITSFSKYVCVTLCLVNLQSPYCHIVCMHVCVYIYIYHLNSLIFNKTFHHLTPFTLCHTRCLSVTAIFLRRVWLQSNTIPKVSITETENEAGKYKLNATIQYIKLICEMSSKLTIRHYFEHLNHIGWIVQCSFTSQVFEGLNSVVVICVSDIALVPSNEFV